MKWPDDGGRRAAGTRTLELVVGVTHWWFRWRRGSSMVRSETVTIKNRLPSLPAGSPLCCPMTRSSSRMHIAGLWRSISDRRPSGSSITKGCKDNDLSDVQSQPRKFEERTSFPSLGMHAAPSEGADCQRVALQPTTKRSTSLGTPQSPFFLFQTTAVG